MKKILIIEDDLATRQSEKKILEKEGYEVLDTDNAKDGVSLAINHLPDLVLMDIRLPNKKRGIGAARIIRANEKTQHIPIIFLTGYAEGKESKEIKNIPNCGYITKPFDTLTLLKEIESHLP